MRDNALRKAKNDTDCNPRLAMIWVFDKSTLNEIKETQVSMNQSWMVERSGIGWSNRGAGLETVGQTNSEGDIESSDRRSDCELMSSSAESG